MTYTTADLAQRFDVDEATIRAMARDGLLPGVDSAGRWSFGEDAVAVLEDLLEAGGGDDDDHEGEDSDGEEDPDGDDEDE